MQWILGALGLGVLSSVGVAVGVPPPTGLILAFIILLLLVVFVGGYLFWQQTKKKRASHQFGSSLSQEAAQAPREIKDPKRQAQYTDEIRTSFMKGIEVYQSRGKDLYSVPWFVIIGESGSGKTEAIRHSNLDFPSGLNDFMQGAGGTLNMDWWFTNHGVILDTAGKMVFPEMGGDRAGSPQWEEFLKLLKKNRSNCPINGLLLVLSVDSLIGDSAAKISEKAGRIARQLDLIQRALDVRFPVSVLITKCDKLTGFREFFEQIDEPELQDQMLGWSNPDALDAAFRPDLVDQHLEQVIQRLRKRRLGLLRDPMPAGGPRARRADEVDALYALPKSLSLIAPRLRRYLETIFVAGEFSAKPVFLRGIYFTSAMQVGADMDEAVWAALGRTTTEASTSGASQHDLGRPFFLRHVFLEKVFRERGLVTRATNTKRMLMRRKLTLIGVTSACLLLVLVFGLFGKWRLQEEIGKQSELWAAASKNWTQNPPSWNPLVMPGLADPWIFQYRGTNRVEGWKKGEDLIVFHSNLCYQASRDLKVSWVFFPVKWFIKRDVLRSNRQAAQQAVFERSVVVPLIENARAKMGLERAGVGANAALQAEALKALIRLEADLARGSGMLDNATNGPVAAGAYLLPFLGYLTQSTDFPGLNNLGDTLVATYRPRGSAAWPPPSLRSGGTTLVANTPIDRGLTRFFENARQADVAQAVQLGALESLCLQLTKFEAVENLCFESARGNKEITEIDRLAMERAKLDTDALIQRARTNRLFVTREDSVEGHLKQISEASARTGNGQAQEIRAVMSGGTRALTNQLFAEIGRKLGDFQSSLSNSTVISSVTPNKVTELSRDFLRYPTQASLDYSYAQRFQLYTQAFALRQALNDKGADAIGTQFRFLTGIKSRSEAVRTGIRNYQGGRADRLNGICDHLVRESENVVTSTYIQNYAVTVANRLAEWQKSPQAQVDFIFLTNCHAFMTNVEQDLAAAQITTLSQSQQKLLLPLTDQIGKSRLSLITAYAAQAEGDLRARVGFPILRDEKKTLSMVQVQELNDLVNQRVGELTNPIIRSYPPAPLERLSSRLRKCQKILAVFVGADKKGLTYLVQADAKLLPPSVFSFCRALSVSENGQSLAKGIDRGTTPLGEFLLDQKLVVISKTFVDSPTSIWTNSIADWAALRLAHAPRNATPSLDRKMWEITLQAGPNADQTVKLQLLFKEPLPDFSEWPSASAW